MEDSRNFILNNSNFKNNFGTTGGGANIHRDVYTLLQY